MPELPFPDVEPYIWQIPILVLTQALMAYGFNLAGWSIDPVTFFFVPIILAILFWKQRSYKIITDYLGFNTKNLAQKILASMIGACVGLSLYLLLKYTSLSLIPYATFNLDKLAVYNSALGISTSSLIQALPIILSFFIVYLAFMYLVTHKLNKSAVLFMLITLVIPFLFVYASPIGVLNMIIGYGEEILCLLFALIAINWLVKTFNMSFKDFKTHLLAWVIARSSWAIIHALSTYGFVVSAYISAFILGMIFTLVGYMFWYRELAIPIMFILGALDLFFGIQYGYLLMILVGSILLLAGILVIADEKIFRDNSLKFKEYVIYGAAMAHAMYDLSFTLFP